MLISNLILLIQISVKAKSKSIINKLNTCFFTYVLVCRRASSYGSNTVTVFVTRQNEAAHRTTQYDTCQAEFYLSFYLRLTQDSFYCNNVGKPVILLALQSVD